MSGKALSDTVIQTLPAREADATLHVAYSGGLDSTVLLHLIARSGESRVQALHVHHGLQPAADAWAAHCARFCEGLGIPFRLCRVQVQSEGRGTEAAARDARYAALRAAMGEGDVLATAHHQNDQAETVLLRLLRGTGPAGLAAMRPLTTFAPGRLWRPLLDVPRSSIEAYAREHALRWIEDPHNQNPQFARSYLRREILPRLDVHWPGAAGTLARAATLSAESADLLRELATTDIAALRAGVGAEAAESSKLVIPAQAGIQRGSRPAQLARLDSRPRLQPRGQALRGNDGNRSDVFGPLPISALRQLSPARRRNALRAWIEHAGLPLPYHDTLLRLDGEVLAASGDADPLLAWPGGEFRRYRDLLFVMALLSPVPADFSTAWNSRAELSLPAGCGRLRRASDDVRDDAALSVRLVQPGERFRPAGSKQSRSLKNLFQERGVPTWVRERTPMLERKGQAIWIGGIGCAADVARVEVEWLDAPPGAQPA